jgi:NAD(P)-dependent dehydrogenase (short-subunit alcohol dehydrogenase family)
VRRKGASDDREPDWPDSAGDRGRRGIGRAIAVGLARAGADVLVTARSGDELAETAAAIEAAGPGAGQARMVAADIADDRQRQRVMGAGLADGRVDVLVNNAATVEPLGRSAAIGAGGSSSTSSPRPLWRLR